MKTYLFILIFMSKSALAADPPLTWSQDDNVGSQTGSARTAPIELKELDVTVAPPIDPGIGEAVRAAMAKERHSKSSAEARGLESSTPPYQPAASDLQTSPDRKGPNAAADRATVNNPSDLKRAPTSTVVDPFAPVSNPQASQEAVILTRDSILNNVADGTNEKSAPTQKESRNNEIEITNSNRPTRGINVRTEMPSVRHITMSPGNKWFGGDDVEIAISPIFDIVMQMPDSVEWFNPSSDSLIVEKVPKQPTMLKLKLKPIQSPVPMSLQIVDVYQKIWTFTVIGVKADIATEYPKTILVNKKVVRKTVIGSRNPSSILNALPIEYAVQVVVGDLPNTSEFKPALVGSTYMHHEGYATYLFSVSKKDGSAFEKVAQGQGPNLKFTMWANGHRIDGGGLTASGDAGSPTNSDKESTTSGLTRDVEWTIENASLSKAATHKNGKETYIVICQVRASLLDLEDWVGSFVTISDSSGYTRFDFAPYRREFRASSTAQDNEEN